MDVLEDYKDLDDIFKGKRLISEKLKEEANILLKKSSVLEEEILLKKLSWWIDNIDILDTSNIKDLDFLINGFGEFAYVGETLDVLDKIESKLKLWANSIHPYFKWRDIWLENRTTGNLLKPRLMLTLELPHDFRDSPEIIADIIPSLQKLDCIYRKLYPYGDSSNFYSEDAVIMYLPSMLGNGDIEELNIYCDNEGVITIDNYDVSNLENNVFKNFLWHRTYAWHK